MKNFIFLCAFSLLLTMASSCSSDSSSSDGPISGTFSDSYVTAFDYSVNSLSINLKKTGREIVDSIISAAYAAVSESYECYLGEDIEFDLSLSSGDDINVSTTCSSSSAMNLAIRKEMYPLLVGETLKRTVSEDEYQGSGTATLVSDNVVVEFIYTYKANDAGDDFADPANPDNTDRPCWIQYKINAADNIYKGTATRNQWDLLSQAKNGFASPWCSDGGSTEGAASYRIINGALEIDKGGNNNFNPSSSDYEKLEIQ